MLRDLRIALKRYLKKRAKVATGFWRTRARGHRRAYDPGAWWDRSFFTKGLSDRQTIAPDQNVLTGAYHYASVELLVLRHLRNHGLDLRGKRVCDLGSGSGHWIDFYRSLGASRCVGIDVSSKSAAFLRERFGGDDGVEILEGLAPEALSGTGETFDLVNAVGFMFHVVDDGEWRRTISLVGERLAPGGLFVVGGHFGWLDGVNVQFDEHDAVNKRLRSSWRWKRALRAAGFERPRIYRNRAYLFIDDPVPENNVLVARKRHGA